MKHGIKIHNKTHSYHDVRMQDIVFPTSQILLIQDRNLS